MNITINQMERHTANGVVYTIHWSASKTVDGFTGSSYGTVTLPEKDPADPGFVAYDDITPAIAQQWVRSALGDEQLAAMESAYDAQIEDQRNPKTASGLPAAFTTN